MEVHHGNRLKRLSFAHWCGDQSCLLCGLSISSDIWRGKNSDSLSVLGASFTQVFWHFWWCSFPNSALNLNTVFPLLSQGTSEVTAVCWHYPREKWLIFGSSWLCDYDSVSGWRFAKTLNPQLHPLTFLMQKTACEGHESCRKKLGFNKEGLSSRSMLDVQQTSKCNLLYQGKILSPPIPNFSKHKHSVEYACQYTLKCCSVKTIWKHVTHLLLFRCNSSSCYAMHNFNWIAFTGCVTVY